MKFRQLILTMICASAAVASTAQAASWRYRSNNAPAISGSPTTTVKAGSSYSFAPTASDPDRDRLRFYIQNKPAWAAFSNSSGRLTGTPAPSQVGTYSNVRIYVSDGKVSTYLPAFSIAVTSTSAGTGTGSTPPANHDPVISGSPSTSVEAGRPYSFQPSASDADGNTLSFSVSGKPSWATFSVSNGSLTGTPTTAQAGSYSGIVISVNDGTVSKSMAAFAITVTAPATSGSATLSWTAPTLNTDGSLLTNLGGYRIYHGTSASSLNDVRTVAVNSNSYEFTSLPAGTHYFAISAYNTDGAESARSSVGSKAIP